MSAKGKLGKNDRRGATPATEKPEKETGRKLTALDERTEKALKFSAIFALLCCGVSLHLQQTPIAVFCLGVCLVLRLETLPRFLERHGAALFMAVSALIVCFGIAVRIVMYTKCRSLWLDEASLAESIVARSWKELLASPLGNGQSAPVLYVIAVKAIGSVLGYSEFSLRILSFFFFIGLLVCEWVFLKNVLKIDGVKTAFVLTMTSFVPSFVYYSNELKPYMGDAFFVALALLLYAVYAQKKISLIKLTVFYVLILGFCTPAIFFIGGILTAEFSAAAFAKAKKHALYVAASGLLIAALFGLYYYWWMLPVTEAMDNFWNKSLDKTRFNAYSIVLVVLLYALYTLHSRKKASLIILTLSYMLICGLCPPAALFVGGILAGELLAALFAGSRKRIASVSASLLSVAAAFGLVYRAWPAYVTDALKNFWNNPDGKTRLINEVKDIFTPSGQDASKLVWALAPFALLGVYSLFKQKNKLAHSIVLSVLFVCFACSIGKWPPAGRIWLFLPAVVLIFSAVGYDFVSKYGNIVIGRIIFCLFSAVTVFYAVSSFGMFKDGAYRGNQEVSPLIDYVKEHIKNDEKLYVYPAARCVLLFKNNYNGNRIGKTDKDNIIFGVNREEWNQNKAGAELDTIIKSRKAYLLFQHFWFGINPGLEYLQNYGTITQILDYHDTPLLYFEAKE